MEDIDHHRHLPDGERLSTLTAMILLAYALSRYIQLPGRELSIQLPGLYFGIRFGVQELVALIVALMTVSGADWLLQSHPHRPDHRMVEHWVLPGITAWAIGLPLLQLPLSPAWWLGFALGGVLLILVLIAEYIVVDAQDMRRPLAGAGLTALSFALYLVLTAAFRFTGIRLFLLLPGLTLATFLVSLRTLRLRQPEAWMVLEAGLITLITVQIATALHYLPLTPVRFGLALLGPAYSLTNLFGNLADGETIRQALVEPVVVLALIWSAAFLIK
jgi:hypothetical protein